MGNSSAFRKDIIEAIKPDLEEAVMGYLRSNQCWGAFDDAIREELKNAKCRLVFDQGYPLACVSVGEGDNATCISMEIKADDFILEGSENVPAPRGQLLEAMRVEKTGLEMLIKMASEELERLERYINPD